MNTHTLANHLSVPRVAAARPVATRTSTGVADADAALRTRVLARLEALPGWDPRTSNVYVERGTVVLQGLFRDAGVRRAGRRVAEAVPGVQRVWDARVLPRE